MKAAPLINNKLVLVQFSLLFLLFTAISLLGPPRDQDVKIPKSVNSQAQVSSRATEPLEDERGELLAEESVALSEIAPGRLSHKQVVQQEGIYNQS